MRGFVFEEHERPRGIDDLRLTVFEPGDPTTEPPAVHLTAVQDGHEVRLVLSCAGLDLLTEALVTARQHAFPTGAPYFQRVPYPG